MTKQTEKPNSPMQMPDAFVILFVVVFIAWLLTYFIPAGTFQLITNETGQQIIDATSFKLSSEDASGLPLFATNGEMGLVNYAFEGMTSGARMGSAIGVMMFILIVGGAFGVIMETGAINNGILALIAKTQKLQSAIIPIIFFTFSLGGAVFGMGEEAIAFCILLYPLMLALGYDAITTVLITYVATQIGFATSWMNPFNVAVAQGLANIPVLSGAYFRMAMWAIFTLWGVIFTIRYARKVKANPASSLSFESDNKTRTKQSALANSEFNFIDKLILSTFVIGLVWIIWGVLRHGYYIPEIATQFFTIGLAIGIIAIVFKRLTANKASSAFQQGAAALLPAALIVGMAKGVLLMLGGDDATAPSVLNTLLHNMGQLVEGFSGYVSSVIMLVTQSIFNFFVASGSGQAALTMPLMAPLADIVGITRQTAVLAFQLGDGLTNLIIPTSASLIGCLGAVKLDWATWLKFIWKFQLSLAALATVAMLIAVQSGF
jgi:uncharacterized ion transporter superfamily protein YfcC